MKRSSDLNPSSARDGSPGPGMTSGYEDAAAPATRNMRPRSLEIILISKRQLDEILEL